MMDGSSCAFLSFPAELRQQIYALCFSNTSEPESGLLGVNRSIRHESVHFIQKYEDVFTFHIVGRAAGFDRFAQWCLKIKGYLGD